jgi:acetolactate synthase small subunit
VARDSVIERIRAELSANIASRKTSDVQFASFVARELATVKAQLESETASREKEDDAIEASLSQFTVTLQKCMHVVNQTE